MERNRLPKVSIIIPLYNVENYVEECLISVANQTYLGEIECVVVDDCSTDKSAYLVSKFVSSYFGPVSFRVLHHKHNRGLSAARNTGVDNATGDYIYFLDSDDYISNDCLEVLTKPLLEKEWDMVLGDLEMFGNPRDICFLPKGEGGLVDNASVFNDFYVKRLIYVMAYNKLTNANLFRLHEMSFMEGQLHEDELWTYKCCLAVESLYVCKRITYYYRIREGSITAELGRNLQKRMDSCYLTLDYVLTHPAPVRREWYDRCVVYYFGVYLHYVLNDDASFRKEYVSLRKRFEYHPLKCFAKGELSFCDVKHQFHFVLSPGLGYYYLKLKRLKHRISKSF